MRFRLTCIKTWRFWDRGLASVESVHRMARHLGLKDYTHERIA